MNNTTKNIIIQEAICKLKDKYNIIYKQVSKIFIIDNIQYDFKYGLIKIEELLENE